VPCSRDHSQNVLATVRVVVLHLMFSVFLSLFLLELPLAEGVCLRNSQMASVRSRYSAPAPPSPDENPYEEFVIERLLSHGVDDDGNVVMRVRWFGFGSDDDSWELYHSSTQASSRALCEAEQDGDRRPVAEPSVILIDVDDHPRTDDAKKGDVIDILCRDNKAEGLYSLFRTCGDPSTSQSQPYPLTVVNILHNIVWSSSRTSTFPATPLGRDLSCFIINSTGVVSLVAVFSLGLVYMIGVATLSHWRENKSASTSTTKGSVTPTLCIHQIDLSLLYHRKFPGR
jgi:hypothetical protein